MLYDVRLNEQAAKFFPYFDGGEMYEAFTEK